VIAKCDGEAQVPALRRREAAIRANIPAVRAVVLVLAGCGRLAFAPLGDGGGDAADGAAVGDAAGDGAVLCTTWGAFGPAQRLAASSTPGNDDWLPRVGRDNLTLIVDRWTGTDFDLAIARRASPTVPFGLPTVMAEVSTAAREQSGQLSPGEDRLYLLETGFATSLRQYTREATGYVFARAHANIAPVTHYWISDDELRAYWLPVGGSTTSLMLSTRTSVDAAFEVGTAIGGFPTGSYGVSLALTPDELELFVALPMPTATDDLDLFRATRATRDDPFGPLMSLGIDTARDDVIGSISSDGTTLYLNLDTLVAGGGDADVWIAERTCLD
jgi:hypothetical protein